MKTSILTILVVLIAATANAETRSQNSGAFDGAFVGAQFGAQSGEASETNVQTTLQPGPSFDQPDAAGRSGVFQLHSGYGRDVGPMLNLSAGAFFEFGGARLDVTEATALEDHVAQSITKKRGLYIAPGIYSDPTTLVYGKVGMAQAAHRYTRADYGVALDKRISGRILGLGIKGMLDDHMFWTIEYTRVDYGLLQIGTSVPLSSFTVDVRSRAVTEDLSLGFGYQF